MRHHHIDMHDNPCMKNTKGITWPEEDATVPIYISGTVVCADTLSPTHQNLEDYPQMVLISPHDWDPHSVCFPKGSRSREDEYLFAGISEICIDALGSKVHETEIELGICDTVHALYFIATRLVSQLRIADAKVPDATRINDIEEDGFEGQRQDVPSHRTFMSK